MQTCEVHVRLNEPRVNSEKCDNRTNRTRKKIHRSGDEAAKIGEIGDLKKRGAVTYQSHEKDIEQAKNRRRQILVRNKYEDNRPLSWHCFRCATDKAIKMTQRLPKGF